MWTNCCATAHILPNCTGRQMMHQALLMLIERLQSSLTQWHNMQSQSSAAHLMHCCGRDQLASEAPGEQCPMPQTTVLPTHFQLLGIHSDSKHFHNPSKDASYKRSSKQTTAKEECLTRRHHTSVHKVCSRLPFESQLPSMCNNLWSHQLAGCNL